jgi:DGQHR domain-containing protein
MPAEKVIKYLEYIWQSLPFSVTQNEDAVLDYKDDFDSVIDNLNSGRPIDEVKINDLLMSLKGVLESIEDVKGKAQSKLADAMKLIQPNGWLYFFFGDGPIKKISPSKGNDKIQFHTMEIPSSDFEGIRIESGLGETLSWDLDSFELDNQPTIYVASIPAWELDLVSKVPAIEKKLSHIETSKRVLDCTRKQNNWQRRLNSSNQVSISSFFDREDTFFANPIILHAGMNNSIKFDYDAKKLIIDINFFNERKWSMDEDTFDDSRPLTIIDGQHRIRGAANSIKNSHRKIPVVILPSGISESKAGSIFAEINTLSKPLDDKHRIFLAHRFGVKSPDPKFTFGISKDNDPNYQRDRANRKSYELAAKLLLSTPFWSERIKLLKQNTETNQVIDIEKWIEYSVDWFTNYPYASSSPYNGEDIETEVSNYFYAWHSTIGSAWDAKKIDQCLFKSKTQARILLVRFPQVYQKARVVSPEGVISIDLFKQILEPLQNIPVTNPEILKAYSDLAKPEESWKLLDSWVHDAINHGISKTEEEILDLGNKGIAGAGIISEPILGEDFLITIPENGLDPSDGKARYIEVNRPINAGWFCRPQIIHGETTIASGKITVGSKRVELSSENIPIRNEYPLTEYRDNLIIRIIWRTIRGENHKDFQIR